jgi:hypothetical protein
MASQRQEPAWRIKYLRACPLQLPTPTGLSRFLDSVTAPGEVTDGDPRPASCEVEKSPFDYMPDGDKGVSAAPYHVYFAILSGNTLCRGTALASGCSRDRC